VPAKKKEVIVEKVDANINQYKIVFRCLNCGIFFEVAIQKGLAASKANPDCSYCGLSKAGSGTFETILANSEFDKKLQFYP
jgi:transcription elongation factor Elf1